MKYKHQVRNIKQTISLKGSRILKPIAFFLTSALCTLSSGKAAIIHPLNDLKVIEVPISQAGLTRITVKGDRIAHVFGIAGEYVMESDEDQGQVFIRPLEPAMGPISLTLTTEGGHTQDLRLVLTNQVPEALILESKNTEGGNSQTSLIGQPTEQITRNEIEELLSACEEGRIPIGYENMPLDIPTPDKSYHLIREVKNSKLRGLTYKVKNLGSIPWIFAESGFAQKINLDVVAVLMPQKILRPGERMQVYVAAKSI